MEAADWVEAFVAVVEAKAVAATVVARPAASWAADAEGRGARAPAPRAVESRAGLVGGAEKMREVG